MYEAALRFDDLASSMFGGIVVSSECWRIFLIDTKTDYYTDGQWVTLALSAAPDSAFTLLKRVLSMLQAQRDWDGLPMARRKALGEVDGGGMPLELMLLLPRWSVQTTFRFRRGR